MKVSIITITYNAAEHLRACMDSVFAQDYPDIEYILVDGLSKDNTCEIIESYGAQVGKFISEKDQGIYDAMNKGLAMATGDIVGILNADDCFSSPEVVSRMVKAFYEFGTDAVYGNVAIYSDPQRTRLFRYYSAKGFKPERFRQGDMPPHPGFFVKRECYTRFGNFDTRFRIAADFDLLLRLLYVHKISATYLDITVADMLTGGASSSGLASNLRINREMLASCKKNGVSTSLLRIYSKYFRKVFQLIAKPKA